MLSTQEEGHIKLIDFGYAKQLTGDQKTSTNCGTPVYLAPEILSGCPYDYRVDVWALGILICEIITGQTPFQAASTQQVYENIATGQIS